MFTSIFSLAVSVMLAGAESSALPTWQTDYRLARELAHREHKPLAVVIGSGAAGWDKIVAGGSLGSETADVLRTGFVCVYVDNATADGAKLAKEFELADNGLIMSDRTGDVQAFRRAGNMPDAELRLAAVKYSDPQVVVKTTENGGPRPVQPVVYYQPQSSGSCPTCRPAYR